MEILECGDMSAYPEERKAVNVALMRAHVELNLEQATRARQTMDWENTDEIM